MFEFYRFIEAINLLVLESQGGQSFYQWDFRTSINYRDWYKTRIPTYTSYAGMTGIYYNSLHSTTINLGNKG